MQVPRHEYKLVEDAGSEKVAIDVHLTGVTDPSSINVVIEPPDMVTVLVPDRYHLQLTLPVPISPHAERVRFKRRTGKLAMLCTVDSTTEDQEAAGEPGQLQEDADAVAAAAAGQQQLQEDATAAEPTWQIAAGAGQAQAACAASPPTTAAVSGYSLRLRAAAQCDAKLAASALHKAAQLDPSKTPKQQQLASNLTALQCQQQPTTLPGDSPSPSPQQPQRGASAGCQQQQDRQQQAVELESDLPQFVQDREFDVFTRKHDFTLVGCWCAVFDVVINWGVRSGAKLARWAEGVLAERVPCGLYGAAALNVLWCLGAAVAILFLALGNVWTVAWCFSLFVIITIKVCFVPGVCDRDEEVANYAGVVFNRRREQLEDNDSLGAGLTKLLLVAISAAVVWSVVEGLVWVTCVWQLGSHSLGGWVLAALLLLWRVVVWLWRLLLWRPPSWYPLQMLVGGLYSMFCFCAKFTSRERTQDCSIALVPLQIVLTGRGWATVCSFALALLLHCGASWVFYFSDRCAQCTDTATEQPAGKPALQAGKAAAQAGKAAAQQGTADQLPPWWPAAAAGMFPTIVRSWVLLLSHFAGSQAALSAVGAGVGAAVVLLAGGLGGTLSLMQDGLQLLSAACRYSLACVVPGPLKMLLSWLLAALAARLSGMARRLGWWWVQRAAGAVMGMLCWAAPAWYVGPLVQRACAASGVWQEGCLELLQPYAAQAPDSLSLSHSWWFTVIIQVWVGCIFRQLVACRGGEAGGRWLQEERQQRLEAARQRKELKVQQCRQQKRHGH